MTQLLARRVFDGVLIEKRRHCEEAQAAIPSLALRPVFFTARPLNGSIWNMRVGKTAREAVTKMRARMGA